MMLLGKRPRPPIRRTTSMTGITVDLSNVEESEASDHVGGDVNNGFDQNYSNNIIVSPRNNRRNSGDHSLETAHFLRTCGLCKRRLSPGRDIYMYRGDTAFCSQDCRELQMKQDERREKKAMGPLSSSSDNDRH